MTWQIRKLYDEPSETWTGPASAGAPYREVREQFVDGAGIARRKLASPGFDPCKCQLVMVFEDFGEERILAVLMRVERSLGDARGGRDSVHAHARETLSIEQRIGALDYACPSDGSRARHGAS
jgi:hypothetical protein